MNVSERYLSVSLPKDTHDRAPRRGATLRGAELCVASVDFEPPQVHEMLVRVHACGISPGGPHAPISGKKVSPAAVTGHDAASVVCRSRCLCVRMIETLSP